MLAVAGLNAPLPVTVAVNYFGAKYTVEALRPLLVSSPAPRAVVVSSMATLMPIDEGLLRALEDEDEPAAKAEAERIGTETDAIGNNLIYTTTKRAIARWVR